MTRFYTTPSGEQVERTMENFAAGLIPLEDLDDDEVDRLKLKDEHGRFAGIGSQPHNVPRVLLNERSRRIKLNVQHFFESSAMRAAEALVDMLDDDTVSAGDKIRSANVVLERAHGKTVQKVESTVSVTKFDESLEYVFETVPDDPAVAGEAE